MSDNLPPIVDKDIRVPVEGYLSPGESDKNDWATHLAKFGGGGFEIVENIAARDAITTDRRPDKMVYVRSATEDGDPAWYQYKVNAWVEVPMGSGGSTGSPTGIEVDDGTTDAASISKINVKGLHITKNDVANEIDLTSGVDIHMMAPEQQYGLAIANEIVVEPPLNVYDDPDSKNEFAARVTTAEAEIDELQAGQALRPEFKVQTGAFTLDNGVYELEFANPYNTSAITVSVQSDENLGSWQVLSDNEIDIHLADSLISITTASATIGAHSVRVLMNGIVA